ncbi:MAG: FIG002344: Hydrolase (HAD superfamily) [uncultured Sulfurovum sp.]|uniref:Ribonuclease Y n=1 Tax=uncultured Sulfurovum sp. TaxID=269237 RepID=A0A6S6RZV0_9BACT|nr:MAG: FIG002344: Hydrolase (HAD superfamily) [uncultured Sulfurovum sp.]
MEEYMIENTLVALLFIMLGVALTYLIMRNANKKQFKHLENEARAKATAIEYEAEHLLHEANVKIQQDEVLLEKKFQGKKLSIVKQKTELGLELKALQKQENEIFKIRENLDKKEQALNALEIQKKEEISKSIALLEKSASMTRDEAKKHLLEELKNESKLEFALTVKKYEKEAHAEAKKKADYILSQAVTRYAGEFAGERLMNIVTLPSDEHKGRIIGKEGRNIKSLEQLLGVDIIIDETPGVILVSNFNLYRRAIATKTIKLLVEDGRIHPGRIEEVHAKVEAEFEDKILEEGENIVVELGLYPMHEELMRLLGRMRYRASYGQNALAHTLEVAKLAAIMAAEMGGDEKLALRAGLLHDIGKALTQEQGGNHVDLGVEVCRRHNEHPTVINAIYAHHGHEEPDGVESAAVCAADVLSATRPGARREVLESFVKRVKEVETIALSKKGVMDAYAINAGREIRVFVDAGKIDDASVYLLSKEIAKEIENKVQYPGEIKVNVIREKREIQYAR